ncbi:MAG: TerB family tellurite resistance protein [Acetobacter sp.]|jgi:DnaJ like chaperone protein|nr:TerB family tellurite resistance protein [Acetobacter sp.]MCH4061806.1 TerB family tellurite resistance protein [Acetobacter sp.]MCH4089345.1 TerB family tellurite resistance protein [Acetobacter sp.]MCI1294177.1 TerB family tellurite resistance protein [Acetobacter sp.]MCI1320762.1 TerB family tellurite resistance protein [Acetobacter sp.]
MAVWGKFFGGVAGFAVGGPMGAALGTALGHAADRGTLLNGPAIGWTDKWRDRARPDPYGAATFVAVRLAATAGKHDQLYALCSVILSAKLARIDAPVNRQEIDAVKRLFRIPPENAAEVGRMFDLARNRTDDYERFASELGNAFSGKKGMLEDLLGVLFAVARADSSDGLLSVQEERFLKKIHKNFGLGAGAWERASTGRNRPAIDENHAYAVLGVAITDTDETIRVAWRTLIRTHHPDVLTARGASDAEISQAVEKIARINAAWDIVRRDRGL